MHRSLVIRNSLGSWASRLVVASLLVLGAGGCDKAKGKYEECVALEAAGKLVEALEACKAASAANAESETGKKATSWIPLLEERVAKAELEAKKAKGHCPSRKFVTRCTYKGQLRPNLIEEETLATCNGEAHQTSLVDQMTCPTCECVDFWKDPAADEE